MAYGWAVISTGLHIDSKIAPAINATPGAELVATYSRDRGRAEACARRAA
jgi:predicted dehydrogenase